MYKLDFYDDESDQSGWWIDCFDCTLKSCMWNLSIPSIDCFFKYTLHSVYPTKYSHCFCALRFGLVLMKVRYGFIWYINGLVQDCSISSALAMEIQQSCTKPSIVSHSHQGALLALGQPYGWSGTIGVILMDRPIPSHDKARKSPNRLHNSWDVMHIHAMSELINPLWPSDAIWQPTSGSALG